MEEVLVTGVGGFVGYHLARRFLDQGTSVVGIGRRKNSLIEQLERSQRFDFRLANLESAEQVKQAFSKQVGVVYHLAGQPAIWFANSHPGEDFSINVVGIVNILERMRELGGGKIIFASTGEVYQNTYATTEDSPLQPTNFYGLSKLTAENYIRLYSRFSLIRYTILRFSLIYGPHFRRNVLFDIMKGLTKGKEALLYTCQGSEYDLLFVDDAVEALLRASSREWDGEVLNISSGKGTLVKDMINTVSSLLGVNCEVTTNLAEDKLVKKIYSNAQASKMGWRPFHTFEDGVKKTLEWWMMYNGD